jgi:transcriptional regulator with XRE-family HTH domain
MERRTMREWRDSKGWSQYDLAKLVGVHPATIYQWETGKREPRLAQFRKLAEVLDVPMDAIILPEGKADALVLSGRQGSTPMAA